VREAYKGRLTTRDYPQLALFLELDPQEVDVNVHPAKTEVRFRDEQAVFVAVLRALSNALHASAHSPDKPAAIPAPARSSAENPPSVRPAGFWGHADVLALGADSVFLKKGETAMPAGRHPPDMSAAMQTLPQAEAGREASKPNSMPHQPLPRAEAEQERATRIGPYTLLGRIGRAYLVLRDDTAGALVLLDQHAAHERVLFARREQSASDGTGQTLMLPLVLPLHPAERERLEEMRKRLHAIGFAFGEDGQTLTVRGIPPGFSRGEAAGLLRDMLNGRRDGPEELRISEACKASVKAGYALSPEETAALITQWLALPEAEREFCPHGRPCVVRFAAADLEKLFKRRQ
jgi:DNA mismatch repair protein MutL